MKLGEWLTHSGKQSLWQYTIHTPASTVSFHLLLQVCGPKLDPWDLWPAISKLTSLSLGKEGSGKLPELFHMLTTLECSAVITVPSRRCMQCIWGNGDYSQYWTHSRAVNLLILHPQLAVRYPTVQRKPKTENCQVMTGLDQAQVHASELALPQNKTRKFSSAYKPAQKPQYQYYTCERHMERPKTEHPPWSPLQHTIWGSF